MMSDLRTRIAKAICESTSAGRTFPWETLNERERDAWGGMADAVIRELGLQRDDEYELGSYTASGRYRYVTEWSDQPRSAEKLGLVGDGE